MQSLLPLLTPRSRADRGQRALSEGVAAPYVMLRKGKYKINVVEHAFLHRVFDMEADLTSCTPRG